MKKLAVAVALVCAFMAGCGAVEAGAAQQEKRGNFKRLQSKAYRDMPRAKNQNFGRF